MAVLALQDVSKGAAVTFTGAAAGGDTIPGGVRAANWGLRVALLVKNGDVAAHTVTVEGMDPVNVPAGDDAVIPVHTGVYYGTGVPVTYDAVTSVTVAAVRLTGELD